MDADKLNFINVFSSVWFGIYAWNIVSG